MSTQPPPPPGNPADLASLYTAVKKEIMNTKSVRDALYTGNEDVLDRWENFIVHMEPFLEQAGEGIPWRERNDLQAVAGTLITRITRDMSLATATKALFLLAMDAITPHKAAEITQRINSPTDQDGITAVARDYLARAEQSLQAAAHTR